MKAGARCEYSYAKQPIHPTPFLVSGPGELNLYNRKKLSTENSSISQKYPFLFIFFKRKDESYLIGHLIGIEIYARHLTSYLKELLGWDTSSVSQKKP